MTASILLVLKLVCLLTVKQVGTDATYIGIVIAGIAVTGMLVSDCSPVSN